MDEVDITSPTPCFLNYVVFFFREMNKLLMMHSKKEILKDIVQWEACQERYGSEILYSLPTKTNII